MEACRQSSTHHLGGLTGRFSTLTDHLRLIDNQLRLGVIMGRPRKAPARITTFNLPLGVADQIDQLRLSNRSAWMTGVLKDYFAAREADQQAFSDRAAIRADPAALIADIPTKQLAAAFLARIPPKSTNPDTGEPVSNTRLRNLVIQFIQR